MPKNDAQSSQFLDQIIEKTLEALGGLEEFNEATVGRLRDLADAKDLSKPESVVDALVGDEET